MSKAPELPPANRGHSTPNPPKPAEAARLASSLHGETAARRQAITELLFFASVGDVQRCKKIAAHWTLDVGDPNTADYDKRTPLHLACAEGCHSAAAWLITQGANINAIDRFGRTPLEEAVRGDHGELAGLLMQAGARVVAKDGELVELADSPLAGNVRIFKDYDPEWEVDPASLQMLDKIGEGEFGIVHRAMWNGTMVAVKILKETGAVALGDFRTELNVLQKVHHPHTVQFLGAVTKSQPFMIITEYMAGGSLNDLFKAHRFPSVWRAVQLALDCARGLAHLHARNTTQAVIHRDLKPANLMLGGSKIYNKFHFELCQDEVGVLKIADFGLSKSLKMQRSKQRKSTVSPFAMLTNVLTNNTNAANNNAKGQAPSDSVAGDSDNDLVSQAYKLTGETGSYRYMAPEVFRHELYNNKVDVYGWAMIAYQLLEGVPPFWDLNPVDAARAAAIDGRRPVWGDVNRRGDKVPEPLKQVVAACWAAEYERRPEMVDVIQKLEAIAASLPPDTHNSWGLSDVESCCVVQ